MAYPPSKENTDSVLYTVKEPRFVEILKENFLPEIKALIMRSTEMDGIKTTPNDWTNGAFLTWHGFFSLMKWREERYEAEKGPRIVYSHQRFLDAIAHNNLEMYKWLLDKRPGFEMSALKHALVFRNLEIAQWILANNNTKWDTHLDGCYKSDDLNVLQWTENNFDFIPQKKRYKLIFEHNSETLFDYTIKHEKDITPEFIRQLYMLGIRYSRFNLFMKVMALDESCRFLNELELVLDGEKRIYYDCVNYFRDSRLIKWLIDNKVVNNVKILSVWASRLCGREEADVLEHLLSAYPYLVNGELLKAAIDTGDYDTIMCVHLKSDKFYQETGRSLADMLPISCPITTLKKLWDVGLIDKNHPFYNCDYEDSGLGVCSLSDLRWAVQVMNFKITDPLLDCLIGRDAETMAYILKNSKEKRLSITYASTFIEHVRRYSLDVLELYKEHADLEFDLLGPLQELSKNTDLEKMKFVYNLMLKYRQKRLKLNDLESNLPLGECICFDNAAVTNQLHVLKWGLQLPEGLITNRSVYYATRDGNMQVIKYLVEDLKLKPSFGRLALAFVKCSIPVIRYLLSQGTLAPTSKDLDDFMCIGNVKVASILKDMGIVPTDSITSKLYHNNSLVGMKFLVENFGIDSVKFDIGSDILRKSDRITKYITQVRNDRVANLTTLPPVDVPVEQPSEHVAEDKPLKRSHSVSKDSGVKTEDEPDHPSKKSRLDEGI